MPTYDLRSVLLKTLDWMIEQNILSRLYQGTNKSTAVKKKTTIPTR